MEQITGRRRTETLDYIQAMLGQLRTMAQAERCDMLAYLIEMAYLETGDIIRGVRPTTVADGTAGPTPTHTMAGKKPTRRAGGQ